MPGEPHSWLDRTFTTGDLVLDASPCAGARLVGGCRPLALRDCLRNTGFHIDYAQVITRFGVPSEVVVASKQSSEDEDS